MLGLRVAASRGQRIALHSGENTSIIELDDGVAVLSVVNSLRNGECEHVLFDRDEDIAGETGEDAAERDDSALARQTEIDEMDDALKLGVEVLEEEETKTDVDAREGVETVMTRLVVFAESEVVEREGEHGVAGVAVLFEDTDEREIESTCESREAIGDLL